MRCPDCKKQCSSGQEKNGNSNFIIVKLFLREIGAIRTFIPKRDRSNRSLLALCGGGCQSLTFARRERPTRTDVGDLEQRRQELVELEGANARAQAEFAAEATRIGLTPLRELEPRLVLALAFRDMAANADKIGNLTITTEILEQLLNPPR